MLQLKRTNLDNIIMNGDRVLIKPSKPTTKTEAGLYLPQGMHKTEELRTGYVIKVGPGYPIPMIQDEDQPWKDKSESVKYVPLQPNPGDLAVYQQNSVFELIFNGEEYVIATNRAIFMLIREDDLMG